jgi:hypothetical protein
VEKKGLWPIIEQAKIAERYDMAVLAAEGYATVAARTLFAQGDEEENYQLFVLHDADPDGYEIKRTLEEETKRMPDHSINVIDLGLTVQEAIDENLDFETYTKSTKRLSQKLRFTLNEIERDWFEGKSFTKGLRTYKECRRAELNAFTAPNLIGFIERKLKQTGAFGKIIPPKDKLPDLVSNIYESTAKDEIEKLIYSVIDFDDIQKEIAEHFKKDAKLKQARGWIEKGYKGDDSQWWKHIIETKIKEFLGDNETNITDLITEKI